MKITKRYLKQLIKEELAYIMEAGMTDPDTGQSMEAPDDVGAYMRASGEHAGEGGMTAGDAPMTVDPADQDKEAQRVARRRGAVQGTDAVRREINSLHKKGHIDKNTWRKARRALYKGDDGASAMKIVQSALGLGSTAMATYRKSRNI